MRGTKQGDKLSPLLFGLIFNSLLLALRATGVAHRTVSGLRTPARGFADDLVLCTDTAEGMNRLLTESDRSGGLLPLVGDASQPRENGSDSFRLPAETGALH